MEIMDNIVCVLCVCVCAVCVFYLAEECGLELCCGVAGVKKLTKGHLEKKGEEIVKHINFVPLL